ncbi:hypothetical protein PV327_007816 [Microctonus hyperodae]|uniref:Uncharacterized protein n=1 Tax=Microctonus hyperodae TaxID=165561 RepID=A0AA39KYW2_MICHY|nr:hypothetical protein PV327_007816 [Microctonus hyperodae]
MDEANWDVTCLKLSNERPKDSRNLLMDFGVASCKNRFRCRTRRLLGCSYILQVCLSTPLISVVPVYLAYSI